MFKILDFFQRKLTWYLVGCVFVSALLATGCGYLVIHFGVNYIDMHFSDEEVNRFFQEKYVEEVQQYIDENNIGTENIAKLREWTDNKSYVYLTIYQDHTVIFNSDYAYYETEIVSEEEEDIETEIEDSVEFEENVEDIDEDTTEMIEETYIEEEYIDDSYILEEEQLKEEYLYKLNLADGSKASMDIFCYDYWKYYYYVWAAGLAIGIIVFLSMLTRLLKHKFRYINELEKELEILEGGNLEYPITIKGQDELGSLARGIEQMRLSVIENQKREQKMLQANKDLVTSMSHDLRTPLTTLTGYLEILNMQPEKNEQQRKQFLALSLEKTRQIRELSDELFEYFLVYGEGEKKMEVEPVSALALVEDLTYNQFLSLEEKGYEVLCVNHIREEIGNCMIHAQYMNRVLNNIVSNLEKYADQNKPIEISTMKEQQYLVIRVRNGISKDVEPHESTKIGLITCERIMRLHHGEFQTYEAEDEFTVKLVLPLEG